MYVTRPLSLYTRDPSALSLPPPEGLNSGVLVIQDEEADQPTCCFETRKHNLIKEMPFPQDKNLNVSDISGRHPVLFIPVINAPLSSNRYYVIERRRKHSGKTHIKSKEEGYQKKCAYCGCISEKKPENGRFQQFEICEYRSAFGINSSPADANAPSFSKVQNIWSVETSSKHEFLLHEAHGLDTELRSRLPDLNFPLSVTTSAYVIVGEWYSPFIFIQEESLEDQVNDSRYYEITLDQRWEKIYASENTINSGNSVTVDVAVEVEAVAVAGNKVDIGKRNIVNGFMWFRSSSNERGVGLSLAIVERMERMKWEQFRVEWTRKTSEKNQVKVKRVEEFGGNGEWRKFGCYVLVERYLIKRADGNLVLSYEFNHTNQIRTKWE